MVKLKTAGDTKMDSKAKEYVFAMLDAFLDKNKLQAILA
jgi:hypothetical protein